MVSLPSCDARVIVREERLRPIYGEFASGCVVERPKEMRYSKRMDRCIFVIWCEGRDNLQTGVMSRL